MLFSHGESSDHQVLFTFEAAERVRNPDAFVPQSVANFICQEEFVAVKDAEAV